MKNKRIASLFSWTVAISTCLRNVETFLSKKTKTFTALIALSKRPLNTSGLEKPFKMSNSTNSSENSYFKLWSLPSTTFSVSKPLKNASPSFSAQISLAKESLATTQPCTTYSHNKILRSTFSTSFSNWTSMRRFFP